MPSLASSIAAAVMGNLFANFLLLGAALYGLSAAAGATWLFYALLALYYILILRSKAQANGSWSCWSGVLAPVCRLIVEYFDMRFVPTSTLAPNKQYIFCASPHGIHGFGTLLFMWASMDNPLYRAYPFLLGKVNGLVASVLFRIPIVREIFLSLGSLDAARNVASGALRRGNSLHIIVGGEAESLLSKPGTDIVVCAGKKRTGFARLALEHGAELVPFYMFHNTDTYSTSDVLFSFRKWLSRRFQVCLPIWWGRGFTPMPHHVPLTVVMGAPVPLPASVERDEKGNILPAVIQEYQCAYIQALTDLFEKHKASVGYPAHRKLVISES